MSLEYGRRRYHVFPAFTSLQIFITPKRGLGLEINGATGRRRVECRARVFAEEGESRARWVGGETEGNDM